MRRLLLLCCLLVAGCYDSSFGVRDAAARWVVSSTLAELNRLCRGEAVTIERDWVVEGRVTANDRGGNFYRSIVIEGDGAAAELKIGLDALHNDFPLGARVRVALQGLTVGRSYGVLQIGRTPTIDGAYAVEYIGSQAALDRCVQRADEEPLPIEPLTTTIAALSPEMAGRLIRIEGLLHAPETIVESVWNGYRRFTDRNGDVIETYVRSYADFATAKLPEGRCALTGILQYDAAGEGRYLIKLRYAEDCE